VPVALAAAVLAALVPARLSATGSPLHVAVAANFLPTARAIATAWARSAGAPTPRLSAGSTGALYAQIRHGAPYHVFLAADAARPARLEAEGLAVPGTRFTYALGRLVLWAPRLRGAAPEAALRTGAIRRLALASPRTAPYGAAARAVLAGMGLWPWPGRLVVAAHVGQVPALVRQGGAEAGFVAAAQARRLPGPRWEVPAGHHPPLHQQAVLLRRGAARADARAFLAWLRASATARRRIRAAGYGLPPTPEPRP